MVVNIEVSDAAGLQSVSGTMPLDKVQRIPGGYRIVMSEFGYVLDLVCRVYQMCLDFKQDCAAIWLTSERRGYLVGPNVAPYAPFDINKFDFGV